MKQTIRKTISVLLALVMVLALLPTVTVTARADGPISLGNETIPTLSDSETPLTLEAKTDGTIVVNNPKSGMKYSINGGEKLNVTADAITVSAEDKVAFYGTADCYNTTAISGGTAQCYIYGNIMSLIDATNFANATALGPYAFNGLFKGNNCLLSLPDRKLVLPATTLAEGCYSNMFSGCTGLTTAPELPATTLANSCYASMFANCTGLTTAPALPATTLAERCYDSMFTNCTGLTTAPALPATALANSCYFSMFLGCFSLTTAPALPATTLAEACYANMFAVCTSLTTAPALPATTLAEACYAYMFSGCESLTTAPELPATTLANRCYVSMFSGCTGLTTAPALPATTLAESCYDSMFSGCKSLTTAPELPATTLANMCYFSMFPGCTGLTTAPELPATTLAEACYYNMFLGCTGLTTAPELPATTLAEACYAGMFAGCINLNAVTCLATDISANYSTGNWLDGVADTGTFTNAPGMTGWPTNSASGIPTGWTAKDYATTTPTDTTPTDVPTLSDLETPLTLEAITDGTILVNNPKPGMQYSLNGGPKTDVTADAINVSTGNTVAFYGTAEKYLDTTISGGTAQCYIYGNIMSLINATDFASATALTEGAAFQRLFNENTCLLSHPSRKLVLPAITLTNNCYTNMFYGCTGLTTAPELPATTLANYCYSNMFRGCTGLTTAPALPATTLANYCYYNMFYRCAGLTTAPELPATTLANSCYAYMFYDCTGLTTAPELPATTLANMCYMLMFANCTGLTTAPALPATTLVNRCYTSMFSGCTKLNAVTCLATDISATYATANWLEGVASTGTFTKAPAMTGWTLNSASGIPAGWTVKDYADDTPVPYSTYTLTIPAAVTVSGAGWNATGGVGASGELANGKKLTVTAASGDAFALVCEGKGQIGYYLAATATDTQPTTTWTFTALDDDPATQPMGIIVSETAYRSARPGTYTDTVTFTAQVEDDDTLPKLTVIAKVWDGEKMDTVDVDVYIYYVPGETWKQAIENHPTENTGWSFSNELGVFENSKGEQYINKALGITYKYCLYDNWKLVDYDLEIEPKDSYTLVEPA